MQEARFHTGDLVRFQLAKRTMQGEVKEVRGPTGANGRRLYLVEYRFEPQSVSPSLIELFGDELQLVQDAVAMEER